MKKINLNLVEKPVRYIGGEFNSVQDKPEARLNVAIAYPDVYEVGMSELGLQILYGLLNREPWIRCERAFAPWPDHEQQLRDADQALKTLECQTPLSELHIFGFSLQHEMLYTNVLSMLDLGGIPIAANERGENDPLVIAGGPCAYNPMPMIDFIDAFVIGEGEEVLLEFCRTVDEMKQKGAARQEILHATGKIEGVFVPSLFDEATNRLGETFPGSPNVDGVPQVINKRVISDFENSYYPTGQIVPNTKAIHHRLSLEVMRGCPGGCRYCQAGYTDRPVRERSPERIMDHAREGLGQTGFGEVGLLSLSTADYSQLPGLCSGLIKEFYPQRIAISLPSLRIDSFPARVAQEIGKVRKTGMTFAPEAGSERLRLAINKRVDNNEIFSTVRDAANNGQNTFKLYFMIGLPTETDEDLQGIVDMVLKIQKMLRDMRKHRAKINIGLSPFVPKPHTAYQWFGQIPMEEMKRRIDLIFNQLKKQKNIKINWHDPDKSLIESALARADSRVGKAIRIIYDMGARFDEWSEYFNFQRWEDGFAAVGLSLQEYAAKEYQLDDALPWDCISTRVDKSYLQKEWDKTFEGKETKHCGKEKCRTCGVCNDDLTTVRTDDNMTYHQAKYNMDHGMADELQDKTEQPKTQNDDISYRYRIMFSKKDEMAFTSHHDIMMIFESIFRRSEIELAFSKGFHPHPKIIFASPLPVGMESDAEYIEITTTKSYHELAILEKMQSYSPKGIGILAVSAVLSGAKKITAAICAYSYKINGTIQSGDDIFTRMENALNNSDLRTGLNLLETNLVPISDNEFRLTYTCSVDSGKYTKATAIKEKLELNLGYEILIDKCKRLGIFSRNINGKLEPLIAKRED